MSPLVFSGAFFYESFGVGPTSLDVWLALHIGAAIYMGVLVGKAIVLLVAAFLRPPTPPSMGAPGGPPFDWEVA